MICRLPTNILNKIARETLLTCKDSDKNWFAQIRSHCYRYGLPNPLTLLDKPLTKDDFKNSTKQKVADFWQTKLRKQAKELKSLKYFKAEFMSVLQPHPLLTTAGNSYDINKMIIQLRMLSGRYRVGTLLRHFSPKKSGVCELCMTEDEDIEHILVPRCSALKDKRAVLLGYAATILKHSELATEIFNKILADEENLVQFILDCSVLPPVIAAAQQDKSVLAIFFKVTRTWCYTMHRARLKLLNRWVKN